MEFIIVFITASSAKEAENIARTVVEEGLAGCANIVNETRSIYRWKGKIEDGRELLLIVKTRKELFGRLAQRVKELHSYSVPEIIALPVITGSDDYLGWLSDVTGPATE